MYTCCLDEAYALVAFMIKIKPSLDKLTLIVALFQKLVVINVFVIENLNQRLNWLGDIGFYLTEFDHRWLVAYLFPLSAI